MQVDVREDARALDGFRARLLDILRTPLPMDEETRELTPRLLPLMGQARRLLVAFSDAVEAAQAPGGASYWSRRWPPFSVARRLHRSFSDLLPSGSQCRMCRP